MSRVPSAPGSSSSSAENRAKRPFPERARPNVDPSPCTWTPPWNVLVSSVRGAASAAAVASSISRPAATAASVDPLRLEITRIPLAPQPIATSGQSVIRGGGRGVPSRRPRNWRIALSRKPLLAALAVVATAAAFVPATPALGITGGAPDTVHTNVGLVRFTTTDGRFRCSGTLISPTVVLTAGHCTEGPAPTGYVSFDNALPPDPLAPGITPAERAARAAHYITGTAHPDPAWDGKLQFSMQHDQGVVVLDAPAATKWPGITPAPLPPVGFLDRNQGRLKNETFTLVGYGVDIGDKKAQVVVGERHSTTSYLKNVGSEVVTFQINENDS